MSLLSVRDLTVVRGGLRVIEGLDFELAAGEALLLRGPNGVGKTSLLRTLAGLQAPLAGRIVCAPDDCAYAGHSDGVKPALTVSENLAFWRAVFGGPDSAPALQAMNLSELALRPAARLSAGQKRRLGLARLMVTGRRIWLLDEPTVSLDAASVGLFARMLGEHLAGGGAAVVATHIDPGISGSRSLDLSDWRAVPGRAADRPAGFNEAFA